MRKVRHLLWAVPAAAVAMLLLSRPVSPSPVATRDDGTGFNPPADERAPQDPRAPKSAAAPRPSADREAFLADGWQLVQAPEPDAKLLDYDPELLDGRELELREQIASTLPRPSHVRSLAQVAQRARADETRFAAVEALGRVNTAQSRNALLDLLDTMRPDELARRAIVPLVRPDDLDDPLAARMAKLLDARAPTEVEKQQLAFTLALVSLRDGTTLPDEVTSPLSQSARERLAAAREIATALPAPHSHGDAH